MNIFILDLNPVTAAKYHCDKHCVKMILETTQILSTVMHNHGMIGPYRKTHASHPCVLWAGQSIDNWNWTSLLLDALLFEYKNRYNREHKCLEIRNQLKAPMTNHGIFSFVQCMPEIYRIPGNAIQAYRNYYLGEKKRFAVWKNGNPDWWQI